jgi:thioredoxin-like negative regulator of GroEL
VELTRALERGEIPKDGFHHASHLHVAWVYLTESLSVQDAANKMRQTLRRLTAAAGQSEKYHDTITLFWVHLLAQARTVARAEKLEDVVDANPQLLEKDFPLAYYSADRLFSEEARASWMEPDLKPLSIDAIAICSPIAPRDTPNRSLS